MALIQMTTTEEAVHGLIVSSHLSRYHQIITHTVMSVISFLLWRYGHICKRQTFMLVDFGNSIGLKTFATMKEDGNIPTFDKKENLLYEQKPN